MLRSKGWGPAEALPFMTDLFSKKHACQSYKITKQFQIIEKELGKERFPCALICHFPGADGTILVFLAHSFKPVDAMDCLVGKGKTMNTPWRSEPIIGHAL